MSGYSNEMGPWGTFQPIVIGAGNYNIGWKAFDWGLDEKHLTLLTGQVLDIFATIQAAVVQNIQDCRSEGRDAKQGIRLEPDFGHKQLSKLAALGMETYRDFFKKEARQLLDRRLATPAGSPVRMAPTFVSAMTPFPWEVLYIGDDEDSPETDLFWGYRYTVGRILDNRDIAEYLPEQDPTSNMLICLHHRLPGTYGSEWSAIQCVVRCTDTDEIHLLGPQELGARLDGKSLLEYLDRSGHNMLHFACHARQSDAIHDELEISLLRTDDLPHVKDAGFSAPLVSLSTKTFTLRDGTFQRKPLVFLNACQSGGGGDTLRNRYNLPVRFIGRGAAAVIATACPVPDVFASEFARIFYDFFLHGVEIKLEEPAAAPKGMKRRPVTLGEALRLTRRHFWEHENNPLGLAYGLYSPAHYQVRQAPS